MIEHNLNKITSQDLYEIDKGDFQALKRAAEDFIMQVNNISMLYKHGMSKKTIKGKIQDLYKAMRYEQNYASNIILMAHNFERAVNNFMGRTIYLTYVEEDGSLIFYDDVNIGKLYSQATGNLGRGNISKSKIFDANDLQKDLQQRIKNSQAKRKSVYQAAAARWDKSKTYPKNYPNSKNTFYWRLHDHHHITGWTDPIATKGIIAEAYADAVINEIAGIDSSNIEFGLMNLWHKTKKDSIGALVKGDIILNSNGDIQFAVKEGSFSTARVGQYFNLAINIQQLKDLSLEDFQTNLPKLTKLSKAADNIITAANKKVEKTMFEIIKS